jgi:DNA-binding MarR family transcriptional regulator
VEAAAKAKTPTKADRELAVKLGSLLMAIISGRSGEVVRLIDESGLSFVQMKALFALQNPFDDAAPTVTGLADTLGLSAASASRAVDGLVRRKLVTRLEDAEDRRVRRITITGKGQELADRIMAGRLHGLEDFAASLSAKERRELEGALDTLLQRPDLASAFDTNLKKAEKR